MNPYFISRVGEMVGQRHIKVADQRNEETSVGRA